MFKTKRFCLILIVLFLPSCLPIGYWDAYYIKFSDYAGFSDYMGSAPLNKEEYYISLPSNLDEFDILDFQIKFTGSGTFYVRNPKFIPPEILYIKYRVDVANVESVTLQIEREEKIGVVGAIEFKRTKAKIKNYPSLKKGEEFEYITDSVSDYQIFSDPAQARTYYPLEVAVLIVTTIEDPEEEKQIKDQLFADIKDSLVTYRI